MAGVTFRYFLRVLVICFHFILIGIMFRLLLENEQTNADDNLWKTAQPPKPKQVKELPRENCTEKLRLFGPGENGIAVAGLDNVGELRDEINASIQQHGFNDVINRMVSVYRVISDDFLPKECKAIKYPDNLPEVSIVIPFRNEAWDILLRTVHSILRNSPLKLLKEIILVDDGSTSSHLKTKLDIYVTNLPLVQIIRLPERKGLMVARQTGIEATSTDHFIVMDSHMEVIKGWLEPLMARLAERPTSLVHSRIGSINSNDFGFKIPPLSDAGRFTWFDFFLDPRWFVFSDEAFFRSRKSLTEPIGVPLIAGMMIGMNKRYFLRLGGFDTGMKIWGSEQVELSIKVWMCGGVVEEIPCSCAGHMYRAASVWIMDHKALAHNKLRVADVWMDQYADIVHEMICNYTIETSDVEDRKKIRKANKCKNFDYYLEIVRNMSDVYIPKRRRAKGQIVNAINKKCVDKPATGSMLIYPCHSYSNQFFEWSDDMEIRSGVDCVIGAVNNTLFCDYCFKYSLTKRQWNYRHDMSLMNRDTGLCLSFGDDDTLKLEICDGSIRQKWHWKRLR